MKKKIVFSPIDLETWKRGSIFYYFSNMAPTGYSITVDIDVTHMRTIVKKAGLKIFPAYLWLVTKMLNKQQEFKIAYKDGQLGYYNYLTPLYATFHEDDKTFSLMWTEYNEDFTVFYKNYIENEKTYGSNHGILAQSDKLPPENTYTVSCIPWLTFSHFAVHSYENKSYFFPSVESGKFYEKDGKVLMPLSITCHHATTDGWHISSFVEELQEAANKFEQFIK